MTQPNDATPANHPPIDTWSEAWRHECEVRWVANLPSSSARRAYLDGIEQRRGKPAADRLRAGLTAAWQQRKRPDPQPV